MLTVSRSNQDYVSPTILALASFYLLINAGKEMSLEDHFLKEKVKLFHLLLPLINYRHSIKSNGTNSTLLFYHNQH